MTLSVLVIGTGGREHALARALSLDPGVAEVHCAPGNPGIAAVATLHDVDALSGASVAALATSLPAMAVEAMLGDAIWPGWKGLLVLVYVALFTSLVGQICWIRAVEMIGPGRAGVFQNLVPVSGAILSVVILRETFHWHHAASLTLVLAGLFISEQGKR